MHAAPGEVPDQPRVDRAEGEFAAFGSGARAGDVVQQPLDLGAGEVGVQHEARLVRERRRVARLAQLIAHRGGAPILPHDGGGNRAAGGALPDHRGFALIGDADGGDVARRRAPALASDFGQHPRLG